MDQELSYDVIDVLRFVHVDVGWIGLPYRHDVKRDSETCNCD